MTENHKQHCSKCNKHLKISEAFDGLDDFYDDLYIYPHYDKWICKSCYDNGVKDLAKHNPTVMDIWDNVKNPPKCRICDWDDKWDQDKKEQWKKTHYKPNNPAPTPTEKLISQLRCKIKELETIVNPNAQQKEELKTARQELARLEQKNYEQQPTKTNWTLWLICGGIIIALVIGVIAYLLTRNRNKEIVNYK